MRSCVNSTPIHCQLCGKNCILENHYRLEVWCNTFIICKGCRKHMELIEE